MIGETDARPAERKTEANAEEVFLNGGKFCKFCYLLVMCDCLCVRACACVVCMRARACLCVPVCVCMHGCERESVSQTDRWTDKDGDRKRASVFSHAQMHDSFLIFFSALLLQTASLMVSIAFLGKIEDCMKLRER